jgi:hypothetical protein
MTDLGVVPKPRFTSASPAYDGAGGLSAVTMQPRRTARCTAARPSFLRHTVPGIAVEPDPRAGSCEDKAGGVVPAGLFFLGLH